MEISLSSSATRNSYFCAISSELFVAKRVETKTSHWDCFSHSQPKRWQPILFSQTPPPRDQFAKVRCCQKKEAFVVQGSSVDEIYDDLASHLLPMASRSSDTGFRYIVGLAGPPGSGKSTIASEVVRRINSLWSRKDSSPGSLLNPPEIAAFLPMDGFHLYRSQLDAMEDPEEAHARRGAPWTFNPELLLTCLKNLRVQGSVSAPSFDHGVGDPVEDDILISDQHKLVIVEGNYLLLEDGTWNEISSMFDEKWFIDIDIDKSMQRVLRRHIVTGKPPDVAKWRIEYNDRPNAELIVKLSKKNADLVIKSVDF